VAAPVVMKRCILNFMETMYVSNLI